MVMIRHDTTKHSKETDSHPMKPRPLPVTNHHKGKPNSSGKKNSGYVCPHKHKHKNSAETNTNKSTSTARPAIAVV